MGKMNLVSGNLRDSCLNNGDHPEEESPRPCKNIRDDTWGVMVEVGPIMTGADIVGITIFIN